MPRRLLAFAIPIAFFASLTAAACALHTDPPVGPEPRLDAQGSGGGGGSGGSDAGPPAYRRRTVLVDLSSVVHSDDITNAINAKIASEQAKYPGSVLEGINDQYQVHPSVAPTYRTVFVLQFSPPWERYYANATASEVNVIEFDGQPDTDTMGEVISSVQPTVATWHKRAGHLFNRNNGLNNFAIIIFGDGNANALQP